MVIHMLALIVVKSDALRDSLVTLLKTMPQIEAVACAQDATSARKLIDHQHPAFVVMDTNATQEETWELLHELKRIWPQTVSLVLADTVQHQERARGEGVPHVVLKGYPAQQLSSTIELLLT